MSRRRMAVVGGLVLAAGLLVGCTPDGGSAPTRPPTASAEPPAEIMVGDCLNDAELSGVVSDPPIVPCDEPHDSEAFGAFDLPDGEYPGREAIDTAAQTGCEQEFEAFVGIPYDDSELDFTYYFPTEKSWGDGDRQIMCVAFEPDSQTTGSLRDAAR